MDGDGYDREDRGDDRYPYYRPSRALSPVGGSGAASADGLPDLSEGGGRRRRGGHGRRRSMPLWQELPLLLIVAFCLAVLIRTFLLQAFYIPSGSMEDTLAVGDRVLVNKIVYDMRTPERGEIVVFSGTETWAPEHPPDTNIGFFAKLGRTIGDLIGISRPGEKDFIKRVIGLPGDEVSCCDARGRVYVNGVALDETYVTEDGPEDQPPGNDCRSRKFNPVTVEPGHIFVMGDHRLVSQDSRCQGQVPIDNVIGRAFAIVWPSSRWESLGVPDTFKNVPKPYAAPTPPTTEAPPVGFAMVLPLLLSFASVRTNSLGVTARSTVVERRRRRRLAG